MTQHFSYWEYKEWFKNIDFTIIGSGIVGLNCAIALRKKHPKATVLIVEKGMLPQGASTKNAGFACFGSLSEIIEDLETHSPKEVFELVNKRWKGLQLLRKNLGDNAIDYQQNNGYELFLNPTLFEKCIAQKKEINQLLQPIFNKPVFSETTNIFGFQKIHQNYIVNQFEGQIDTGKMMTQLLQLAQKLNIKILNNCTVTDFNDFGLKTEIHTPFISFNTHKLFIATNGFSHHLLQENIVPARTQVLITKPIKNLSIKGTFHLEKGYYYFRNIDNRILLGGGRNLDLKGEETTKFGITSTIQQKLETLLYETILPNQQVEVEYRWSGIMGVGNQKKAIVKQVSNNVFCGIRLGGMGVAIGSLVGKEMVDLL